MYDHLNSLLVFEGFKKAFILNFINENRYMFIVKGLGITLEVTFFAIILGIIIGFIMAFAKLSNFKIGQFKIFNFLATLYIDVIRGTPAVVQLLIIYYIIFGSMNVSKVIVAVIAFGINSGAYVAEIIRAGILAVDHGQMEAGRSLGLSHVATMRYIIIPQAIKNILPALGNEFIVLLKETAIVGYIALEDLTKAGDVIRSRTFDPYMPLLSVALIYLLLTQILSRLLGKLERRLRQSDSR
ncbi:MAG: amino acid ABC transporter permease [Clostridiaceae bacterium]|nr:amino acid ABC transporter permease [Clostridiaceae bacterium]